MKTRSHIGCVVSLLGILTTGSAWATALPGAVEGVLTLDVASGTTTYDEAVPASVTKVVKTGAGEAVLSVASTSFAGEAEVQAGTLTLTDTDYKALGTGRPVTVASGATLAFKGRTGKSQAETMYSGTVTVSGTGADGKGAIYWAPTWNPTSGDEPLTDSAFKSIVLAADATIGGTKRYGSRSGTIDLRGFTLKLMDTDYMFNTTVIKGPGRVEKITKGTLYLQGGTVVQNGDHTDTFLRTTAGAINFWSSGFIDATLELNGGSAQIGSGDYLSGKNHIAAVKLIGGGRNIGLTTATPMRELNIDGDIDMCQYPFTHSAADAVWHNGSFLNPKTDVGILMQTGGLLIYTNAAVTCQIPQTFVRDSSMTDDRLAPRIDCRGGNVQANFLRLGDSGTRGVARTTAGLFNAGGEVYCGQSGIGTVAVEGGHFRVDGMNLSSSRFGHSIVRQTGGLIDNPNTVSFKVSTAGFAGIYLTGGTNTTRRYQNQTERVRLGAATNAVAQLAISGSNTVFETEKLIVGMTGAAGAENIVLSISDGGALAADRVCVDSPLPPGTTYYAMFNGGLLRPYFGYAWPARYYETNATDAAAFAAQCPTRGVVFEKGAVLDMSKTCNDKGVVGTTPTHVNFRFDAPEGQTITSVTLPDSIKDVQYGTPVPIVFESATGYGACAVADVDYDTGKLTGVTLFSGGCNYDANTKVYVYQNKRVSSGEGTPKIECSFTLGTPVGGPLIKRGCGNPHLYIANTYTGGTIIEEGYIQFGTAEAFPSNRAVTLGKPDQFATAVLDFTRRTGVPAFDVTISKLSGYGSVVNAKSVTITEGIEIDAAQLFSNNRTLYLNEPLTFAPGAKITVRDPENLPAIETVTGKICFLYAEGMTVSGTFTLDLPPAYADKWQLRQIGNRLYLAPNRGLMLFVR